MILIKKGEQGTIDVKWKISHLHFRMKTNDIGIWIKYRFDLDYQEKTFHLKKICLLTGKKKYKTNL